MLIVNIDSLLGTTLSELYETGERESKVPYPHCDGKVFSSILILSMNHLHQIHESEENFSQFLNVFARGIATITEEEIDQYNVFELTIRECLICSSSVGGLSRQEKLGQVLRFFSRIYPQDKMQIIVKKYGQSLMLSNSKSLKDFYQRVMYGL